MRAGDFDAGSGMAILTRQVEYKDGDILLEAYVAWDDSSSDVRPGVLISHAWAGRGEFEESKAEHLAELGYVGFALDLYGKGVKGDDPEQNKRTNATAARRQGDVAAAHAPRIGAHQEAERS